MRRGRANEVSTEEDSPLLRRGRAEEISAEDESPLLRRGRAEEISAEVDSPLLRRGKAEEISAEADCPLLRRRPLITAIDSGVEEDSLPLTITSGGMVIGKRSATSCLLAPNLTPGKLEDLVKQPAGREPAGRIQILGLLSRSMVALVIIGPRGW